MVEQRYVDEELEKARAALGDAETLLDAGGSTDGAVNRLYYATFHADLGASRTFLERQAGTNLEVGSMARPVRLTWDDHTWSEIPHPPERARPNEVPRGHVPTRSAQTGVPAIKTGNLPP